MKIIRIGRASDNDFVLEHDKKVSRHHLLLLKKDDGSVEVIDNHTPNGAYINGQRVVSSHRLVPYDVLRIGNTLVPWEVYLTNEKGVEVSEDEYRLHCDQYGWYPSEVKEAAPKVEDAVKGEDTSLDLHPEEYTPVKVLVIGSHPGCDVVLRDKCVGEYHLQMVQDSQGLVKVIDLGQPGGTFVNGQRISGTMTLYPKDTLRVGETNFLWQPYFAIQPPKSKSWLLWLLIGLGVLMTALIVVLIIILTW